MTLCAACVRSCVCVCVRACVRARACLCVRACVRVYFVVVVFFCSYRLAIEIVYLKIIMCRNSTALCNIVLH